MILANSKLVKLRNKINEAFATMDTYMKQRWETAPSFIELTKNYTKCESPSLVICQKNYSTYDGLSKEEKIKMDKELAQNIRQITVLINESPEQKSDETLCVLFEKLSNIDDNITNAKKHYNYCVKCHNDVASIFPCNLV